MRTSCLILCLISLSFVSGLPFATNDESAKSASSSDGAGAVPHVNHTHHGHHGHNDHGYGHGHGFDSTDKSEKMRLAVITEHGQRYLLSNDTDTDADTDGEGRRLLVSIRKGSSSTPRHVASTPAVTATATAGVKPPVVSVATKTLTKEETLLKNWLATSDGLSAVQFCESLGIKAKFDIYNGCLFDMYITKDKQIAKESAVAAEEFSTKGSVAVGKRFCVASGDPHCTNYDGEFFHIQEPGIYTITRSFDGEFEIQEQMRKNGANVPGVPSCMIAAVIRYKRTKIEIDVAKNDKIIVNGVETELPKDTTITIGGIQVRYGKQNIEWRTTKVQTTGVKISTPSGFGVLVTGGYCGVLETSVPESYYGKMSGICGNGNGFKEATDYSTPGGAVLDVKRGTKSWEMSGYGGPTSYLSKWQLSWKPYSTDCLFKTGCETGGALRQPLVTPAPAPAQAPVTVTAKKDSSTPVVVVVASPVTAQSSTKATPATPGVDVKKASITPGPTPVSVVVAPPVLSPSTIKVAPAVAPVAASSVNVADEIKAAHLTAQTHLTKFQETIVKIMTETGVEQRKFEAENKKSYDKATDTLNADAEKVKTTTADMLRLQKKVSLLNDTIHVHYHELIRVSDYVHSLDVLKPTFLKSLDDINSQLKNVRTALSTKLVKDHYKREMIGVLTNVNVNMNNITGFVASYFMKHYEKYNNLLNKDNTEYNADLKKLNKLVEDYRIQAQKVADASAEFNKVVAIVAKLKAAYQTSVAENADLDDLVKRVLTLLKTKNCAK